MIESVVVHHDYGYYCMECGTYYQASFVCPHRVGGEMNPETNKFEKLAISKETEKSFISMVREAQSTPTKLVRPNGQPVPEHWSVFQDGERVVVKNHTFKVVHIGEAYMVLEPVGPVLIGEDDG